MPYCVWLKVHPSRRNSEPSSDGTQTRACTLNEFRDYVADFTLPGVKKQLSAASKIFWAVCFDLTASFFQCALDKEVSRYFCFRAENGKCYAFQRMVMGFAPSCEIMETILEVVIAYALREFLEECKIP